MPSAAREAPGPGCLQAEERALPSVKFPRLTLQLGCPCCNVHCCQQQADFASVVLKRPAPYAQRLPWRPWVRTQRHRGGGHTSTPSPLQSRPPSLTTAHFPQPPRSSPKGEGAPGSPRWWGLGAQETLRTAAPHPAAAAGRRPSRPCPGGTDCPDVAPHPSAHGHNKPCQQQHRAGRDWVLAHVQRAWEG